MRLSQANAVQSVLVSDDNHCITNVTGLSKILTTFGNLYLPFFSCARPNASIFTWHMYSIGLDCVVAFAVGFIQMAESVSILPNTVILFLPLHTIQSIFIYIWIVAIANWWRKSMAVQPKGRKLLRRKSLRLDSGWHSMQYTIDGIVLLCTWIDSSWKISSVTESN